MRHFHQIAAGIDVLPAVLQLSDHREFWNGHPGRTDEDSPHYGVSDIWLRYGLPAPEDKLKPHISTFYPAWSALPALRPIVFGIMARVEAVHLGGILVTKIPAGGRVKPHHDRGSWHAEHFTRKVYVVLQGNPLCVNRCEDEAIVMPPGSAWTFNNLVTHSVENNGSEDRMTLIISMRCE